MPMSGAMSGAGPGAAGQGAPNSAGDAAPNGDKAQQIVQDFKPLAESLKALGEKYPEGQEMAAEMLKSLQRWMAQASGNPQRVPEKKAPPNA